MTRFGLAMLLAAAALACTQKTDQRTAEGTGTETTTQPAKQSPPRPAIKQSDARVWVEAVTANKGQKGSFKVNYYGVEEAKAIVIPLTVPVGMHIDSVSFVGSMLSFIATRPTRIDNDNHMVLMTAIPTTEPNIPASEGLLASVHFTLGPDAVSGMIDETFVPPGNYLTYVDTASTLVEPRYEAGKVTVQ